MQIFFRFIVYSYKTYLPQKSVIILSFECIPHGLANQTFSHWIHSQWHRRSHLQNNRLTNRSHQNTPPIASTPHPKEAHLTPLHRHNRLLQTTLPIRGLESILQRQPYQRHPLLSHTSPQFRLQRFLHDPLQVWLSHQEVLSINSKNQHARWQSRWSLHPIFCISFRLHTDQINQWYLPGKNRNEATIQRNNRLHKENVQIGWTTRTISRLYSKLPLHDDLSRHLFWTQRRRQRINSPRIPQKHLPHLLRELRSHSNRRIGSLPNGYRQKENDDVLRRISQIHKCIPVHEIHVSGGQIEVLLRGSGSQHPERNHRGGCTDDLRYATVDHFRKEVQNEWKLKPILYIC